MDAKMEKDADSMVVKPVEYAASEYSASSEPPPAYRLRQANSVKIAKIVAFTVILSSFILGSFMLGSTYLQARATCDQVSALDAILDKELMLETMQQDSPRSEALSSHDASENVVQDLSKDEMNKPNKKDETNPDDVESIHSENSSEEDSNDIDSEMKRVHIKLPLDFDLSELAHNILMNNQKSRMNCVVERRRTEEVDEPKPMNPFSVFMNEPKKEKVTGERIAIFCETGAPKAEPEEPVVQIRRIVMPFPFANPQMHRFGPIPPPFQQQPPMGPQFPPQFNQMNMNMPPPPMNFQGPPQMNLQGPPSMNFQGPPQMNFQGPPQMNLQGPPMNFQGPPMNFQGPPMNFQGPPQMNSQPNFQPPQIRMSFPSPQTMRFPQQQLPPVPAQSMSPPRPEVPQFRLINPAPQQQLLNFERPEIREIEQPDQTPQQPEVRIHLRRIQLPGPIGDIIPFLNNIQNDMEKKEVDAPRPNVQVQQMPLAVALSKVGITPDDLRNIQRMAEEKFQEHIRELVADEDADADASSDSDSSQSEEESDSETPTSAPEQDSSEQTEKNQPTQELLEAEPQQKKQQEQSDEDQPQILALGRSNFGRSLNQAVQLPARMNENPEIQDAAAPFPR